MGWNINETANTVVFTEEQARACAIDVYNAADFYDYDDPTVDQAIEVVFGGWWSEEPRTEWTLFFNSDHMEHMDWLTYEDAAKDAIAATGVSGDICFGSEEGDNAGSYWGVRFNGDGTWVDLVGRIQYVPAD